MGVVIIMGCLCWLMMLVLLFFLFMWIWILMGIFWFGSGIGWGVGWGGCMGNIVLLVFGLIFCLFMVMIIFFGVFLMCILCLIKDCLIDFRWLSGWLRDLKIEGFELEFFYFYCICFWCKMLFWNMWF